LKASIGTLPFRPRSIAIELTSAGLKHELDRIDFGHKANVVMLLLVSLLKLGCRCLQYIHEIWVPSRIRNDLRHDGFGNEVLRMIFTLHFSQRPGGSYDL
jgi:hypothetical protein